MSPSRFVLAIHICLGAENDVVAETIVRSTHSATACHDEDVKIAIWISQRVVSEVSYGAQLPTMQVDWRHWMAIPFRFQEDIARSAYCRVQVHDVDGTLEVRSGNRLVGSITRGIWHNSVSGE